MPIIPAFATEVQVYIDSCTVAVVYFRQSGYWKEHDWKIGDKKVWRRDVWTDLSKWPMNIKIFVPHVNAYRMKIFLIKCLG